ncbi:hypothetical protein C8R45DRAFT_475350 [Mycena sanguinolenta]|nr:hypothetical protein C8R45DRAFT_475350 [Mycena sanguinolenta]
MYPFQPPPAYHAHYQNNYAPPAYAGQIAQQPPPVEENSNVGRRGGIFIHVCANCNPKCVKCNKSQAERGMLDLDASTGDRVHRQINVVSVVSPRAPDGRVPPELQGRLRHFDFTVQLSRAPNDNTWLFDDTQLMAVISPLVNGTSRIDKSFPEPGINAALKMSRVNIQGPTYTVCVSLKFRAWSQEDSLTDVSSEWILQSIDQYDVGLWGWYRYHNGSIRVWHWNSHDNSRRWLVAWKNRNNWHWFFDPLISQLMKSECEAAAILIICGTVVFNGLGRTLTQT